MTLSADLIDRATYRRNPVGAILAVAPELEPLQITYGDRFRMALAGNPLCPPNVMRIMAFESGQELWELAGNTQLDVATMEKIAREVQLAADQGRRGHYLLAILCVLRNPRCPEHILRDFSYRHPPQVANHPGCPPDLLHRYSLDESNPGVLCSVARHPSTPTDSLLNLLDRRSRDAARLARSSLARRGHQAICDAMTRTDTRGRRHLAGIVDAAERRRLARGPDPLIRFAVAKVENDASVLSMLAGDPHGRVRRAASDRVLGELAISG